MGVKGTASGGVYQFGVPRRDPVTESGMQVTGPLGGANAINFQPTGNGKAAITGDFLVTGNEVNPLIRALRAGDIEVTAIHSHMLDEEPRMFFIHFWANDDALKLAKGVRTALLAAAFAPPDSAGDPQVGTGKTTIVFVCLHGSVKSQMAAAHFNRIASERGLPYAAVSRGIEVDASIPTRIRDGLYLD